MTNTRIAIIGGGPRGLWAVEELINRATRPVDITVFDPYPAGAGAVYRPDQPHCWRLNVASSIVKTHLGSFNDWRRDQGIDSTDPFPPRAQVGEFLIDSWHAAIQRAPDSISVRHLPRTVATVTRENDEFLVDDQPFDHVLLCTGHDHDHPGALHREPSEVPVTGLYFGAHLPRNPRRIGVRGASLTFIDVCLRYGETAEVIYPVTRSGRFMEVKPDPARPGPEFSEELHERAYNAVNDAELRAVLIDAALTLGNFHTDDLSAVLDGSDFSGDSVGELRHSLQIAEGTAPLNPAAAIGAAFRGLFSNFVQRHVDHGIVPGFRELSRTLERVAFGPPPVTARRMLEFIDAGTIQLDYFASPETIEAWQSGDNSAPEIDLLIDATIAPQGKPAPFQDVPGTVAIGRMNEIELPGHDSLSRKDHDQIPQWAEKVANP